MAFQRPKKAFIACYFLCLHPCIEYITFDSSSSSSSSSRTRQIKECYIAVLPLSILYFDMYVCYMFNRITCLLTNCTPKFRQSKKTSCYNQPGYSIKSIKILYSYKLAERNKVEVQSVKTNSSNQSMAYFVLQPKAELTRTDTIK